MPISQIEQATLEDREVRASTANSAAKLALALACGILIGILGGLIGLGGAEFRLPLLIALFGFVALPAVILNKAMSLVVVASALVFRTRVVPGEEIVAHWPIVVNLLAGSLLGVWFGGWLGYAHEEPDAQSRALHSAAIHRRSANIRSPSI